MRLKADDPYFQIQKKKICHKNSSRRTTRLSNVSVVLIFLLILVNNEVSRMMLTKCYLTSHGWFCDIWILKLWHLGTSKPYRTLSYDVSSLLTRSTLFVFVFDSTNFPQNPRNHTKCWSRERIWCIVWRFSIRFWSTQMS